MYIRMISFGTNWWAMHSADRTDPLCFRRRAAYFNAAAVMSGRRLHHSAIFPGQVRFNAGSGFDPQFPSRSVGKTYLCSEPREFESKVHLLVERPAGKVRPDAYLTTLRSSDHGVVSFDKPGWKSAGVRPISISLRGSKYEAMLLLTSADWVESDLGRWRVDEQASRLVLIEGEEGRSL